MGSAYAAGYYYVIRRQLGVESFCVRNSVFSQKLPEGPFPQGRMSFFFRARRPLSQKFGLVAGSFDERPSRQSDLTFRLPAAQFPPISKGFSLRRTNDIRAMSLGDFPLSLAARAVPLFFSSGRPADIGPGFFFQRREVDPDGFSDQGQTGFVSNRWFRGPVRDSYPPTFSPSSRSKTCARLPVLPFHGSFGRCSSDRSFPGWPSTSYRYVRLRRIDD